jgi:hypothetical protein
MVSGQQQGDIFRDSPHYQSQLWHVAAETALRDIQFTAVERQRRHDYYLAEAVRIETNAGLAPQR